MSELAYTTVSDGVLYDLSDGLRLKVQRKSAQRAKVTLEREGVFVPPETGNLSTGGFREKLVGLARNRFGEVGSFAEELDLVAVAFEEHLNERDADAAKNDEQTNVPELVGTPYRVVGGGFVRLRNTQAGEVAQRLTNFVAKIVRDIAQDDGAETVRQFEIEASLNGRTVTFPVPGASFAGMNWVPEHLGASAITAPGQGERDHARAAIQYLSGDVPSETVFAHTGWRQVGDEWTYLHAEGAIGRVGQVKNIRIGVAGTLKKRALPPPPEGEALIRAVRASLSVLELAPDKLALPVLAAAYRAVLGETDFGLHIVGPTGAGKSELAALVQQHFGAGLDARHLASWESTDNYLEGLAFQAKNQVLAIDDFAPAGTPYDVQRLHRKADRIFRAAGNQAARGRMRADTTLRPEKPPRALIVSTGEDVARGQSLRARQLVLELGPGDLDWERLTRCQQEAASGLYTQSVAAFVRWLAPRYGDVRAVLGEERASLREASAREHPRHKRTSGLVADLMLGLRYFIEFADKAGAVSKTEAQELLDRGWQALNVAAEEQGHHQEAGEPTRRFVELLSAAIASGRAHVADPDGDEPPGARAWGWRATFIGSGENQDMVWRPHGERIGWVDGENLFLQPDAAYAAAQRQGRDAGDSLTITGRTLRKRLHERGLLKAVDDKRQVLTVRRMLGGRRRNVLHLSTLMLYPDGKKPDQPDHGGGKPDTYRESSLNLWSGSGEKPDHGPTNPTTEPDHGDQSDHGPDHEKADTYRESSANGRVGRVFETGEGPQGREVFEI